jgi:hypothetical protein
MNLKKNKEKQEANILEAQKRLNENYLSMGFKYIDTTSNIFSANILDLLFKLEEFVRKGGERRKTNLTKRRRTNLTKRRRTKSIRKRHLKKKTKKKK